MSVLLGHFVMARFHVLMLLLEVMVCFLKAMVLLLQLFEMMLGLFELGLSPPVHLVVLCVFILHLVELSFQLGDLLFEGLLKGVRDSGCCLLSCDGAHRSSYRTSASSGGPDPRGG